MPLITETYYLSLTQDNRGILRLRCSQNDTLRTANLKLYNNGSTFTIPSGISAYVSGVKQNGAVFSKSCTISQDRKSVVLQLSSDITNVDGIIVAEIVLNDGNGDRLGTSNFIIQVEKNPIRAGVIQDTETPIEYVNDFITQIQALTARVNNLITPNGDPSLAEVVDARISSLDGNTYQNLKARIDADIAALNTSKANKADVYTKAQVDTLLDNVEIDVDDEFSDESENPVQNKVINGVISELKADLGAQTGIFGKTAGYYINLTADPVDTDNPSASSTGLTYSIIDCSEGDKFVINAVGATSGRAWGFLDSSNHVLSMADANATVTDLELTAPANAVKLIINDKGGGMSYKVGNNLVSRVSEIEKGGSGLSDDAKEALLACFLKVAWVDAHGRNYYKELENALYPWDYEWYASSMELPKGATYSSYDWTTEQGALILGGGNLGFNYIGDCEIEIVAKYNANYGSGAPTFRVVYEHETDNKYISVVLDKVANDKHSYENTSGSYSSTGILFDEYHTYNIAFKNGVGSVMIDGDLISSGLGASSSNSLTTGISCWANDALTYYKSIKFRRL